METIAVVNIKCGGCEQKITDELASMGINDVSIDVENQKVTFSGDRNIAIETLTRLGYPEASSKEAKSLLKKGKSYLSCAVGRMK
jgi:copper chaperone CopZ